jgi:filamentous hemagglutinin family protein
MKNRKRAARQLRIKLAAIAVASCFASNGALANPTGPTVVNGQVSIIQNGNLLQITNSPNSIINWQSFSIGANEITRFLQQSNSSAVLNRVITQNPSAILGALQSNGRVFLINPNGILFGAGAQVDVAGLIASTLNLSDTDFLAGRLRFTEVPGAGSIVNQGAINAASGGQVYLVGPAVTNSGVITSPKGEVILAAGNSVELVDPGTPNLRVEITAPDNQAINLGQIIADSGRVGIYAGLINHTGTIRADSAVVTEDGRIVLKATKNATLEAGSLSTANGPRGGSITVQSGDTTLVAGAIEAKGSEGAGGTVQLLGNLVGLVDNASISASGVAGGGTVLVGGDFQGKNPDIQNASATYIGPNAMITADAVTSGDGGKVIVWSDEATRAYGTITAQGGAQSGDGGFVEISGKNYLEFAARVDTTAPSGATGTLLLDPTTTTISAAPTSGGTCPPAGPCFVLVGTPATANVNVGDLVGALSSTNVSISTSSGGSGDGDINVEAAIVYSSPKALTLHADRDLNMVTFGNSIVSNSTGALTLEAGRNFNLQDTLILAPAGPLTVTAGNLNVTGVTQPTYIQSSTLNVNVSGGLRVQAGIAPNARASVSSLNGQTINAGFIEVVAQGNSITDISNFLSGNQVINTSGANAGEGLAVRNLGGAGAFAIISQSAAGQSQVITVSDADKVTVNGARGGAQITANAGAQTLSVTGATSVNAINIGSAGALGGSVLGGGSQNVIAGTSGQAGSISIIGPSANNSSAGIVTQSGTGSQTQTIATSGTITVTGGSALMQGANSQSGIFHNRQGVQSVTAANIELLGGSAGTRNGAFINSNNGGDQQLNVSGNIALTGGSGAGTSNNHAQITTNANQTINAGAIALQGGMGGMNNGAFIIGANQHITATGKLTMTGGAGAGAGPRIGNLNGAATQLTLNAGGNVELTSGSASGTAAVIGNPNVGPAQPTNISINAGGSVILNAGNLSGARVGQSENVLGAGGDISITAGGSIQLNGTTQPARIRTPLGNVELHADNPGGSISETPNGFVHANQLTTTSNAGTSLTGPNQVAGFNATNAATGDIAFNNSGNLAVMASNTAPGGKITVNNSSGDLSTSGPIAASGGGAADVALAAGGALNIAHSVTATGTGDVTLAGGAVTVDNTSVVAGGAVSVTAASLDVKGVSSGALIQTGDGFDANLSGDLRVRSASVGGGFGGWAAILAGHGPVNISAGSVALEGGKNLGGFAAITGGPVNVTTTGDFSIAGGSGLGSFGMLLSNQNIGLTVGGSLRLNSGTGFGSFARIQTLYPGSTISVHFPDRESGGYFVNGVEGRISQGLTGFFVGIKPAKLGDTLIITY